MIYVFLFFLVVWIIPFDKVKKVLDKIVYGAIENARSQIRDDMENDPAMNAAIEDFEEASGKLSGTLQKFADKLERGEV